MADRAGAAGDQNRLARDRSVAEQAAPRGHAGNAERGAGRERHVGGQRRHQMFGQRNVFGRGAEGAAVALAVEQPDPLPDAEPRDAVADLVDDPGAIAVGDHARKFHRAIAAGAAADIGRIDAGGLQPDADFARAGHRRRHVAIGQHIGCGARALVPDRLHLQRAREGAAIEQDVLAGDEAGLGAAQERAGLAEFLGVAETPGRIELCALGQQSGRR